MARRLWVCAGLIGPVLLAGTLMLTGCGGGGSGSAGNSVGGSLQGGRTFAATDPALFQSGYFATTNTGTPAAPGLRFASYNSQLDVYVTGSACSLRGIASADDALAVSVDEGPFQNAAPGALNTWTNVRVFASLPDRPHHVSLRRANGASFVLDATQGVIVQGATPALASPASAAPTQWGAQQFPVVGADGTSAYIGNEAGTLVLQKNRDGHPATLAVSQYAGGSLICRATGSGVQAWMLQNGTRWQATIDGLNQPVVSVPDTSEYGWVTLATGLNASATHTVVLTNVFKTGNLTPVYSLQFPGGTLVQEAPPHRPVLAVTGNSLVAGDDGLDLSQLYYLPLAQAHGYAVASRGHGGVTFLNTPGLGTASTTNSVQARLNEVVAVQPDICVVDAFINDIIFANKISPPETPAKLEAGLQDYLAQALQKCPNTRFYVLGLLADKGLQSQYPPWLAAIQNAVAAQNSPRCIYVSEDGWIDPTTDTFADGLHPNVQGNVKIAARLAPILFP